MKLVRPYKLSKKLNNKGLTLVSVLIVIAFIAIIGTAAIMASLVNLKMKMVSKNAQKNFYSCDEAVDALYAGIGQESMACLEEAYKVVMARMVRSDKIGDVKTDIETDQDANWKTYAISGRTAVTINGTALTEADVALREKYIENVINKLTTKTVALDYTSGDYNAQPIAENAQKQYFLTTLNNYITNGHDPYAAKVVGIGDVTYQLKRDDVSLYVFQVKDVHVQRVDQSGYQSDLKVDIQIKLPLGNINFSENSKSATATADALEKFSLIADNSVVFSNTTVTTVDGSVYAGNNGITVNGGSTVNLGGVTDTVIIGIEDAGGTATDQGALTLLSGTKVIVGGNLWCKNIIIPKTVRVGGLSTKVSGAELTLKNAVVQNDLQINGVSSKVSITGSYFGYNNKGMTGGAGGAGGGIVDRSSAGSTADSKDLSSAIMVNGAYSNLDFSGDYLFVAGHAYILFDENGTTKYRTGEGLSFKGDQEMYLVPSTYINAAAGATIGNPVVVSRSAEVDTTKLVKSLKEDFFLKDGLDSTPYLVQTINGEVFYYLNFKDATSVTNYMKAVLMPEASFEFMYKPILGAEKYENALKLKESIKKQITVNLETLNQQMDGKIILSPGKTSSSGGVLIAASADAVTGKPVIGSYDVTDMALDTNQKMVTELGNRYKMLTKVIDMPAFTYSSGAITTEMLDLNTLSSFNGSLSNKAGRNYHDLVNRNSGTTVASRLFEKAAITQLADLAQWYPDKFKNGNNWLIFSDRNMTFDSSAGSKYAGCQGGIIVCRGDVIVKSNFDGLIVAISDGVNGGRITVDSSVTITNSLDLTGLVKDICERIINDEHDPANYAMSAEMAQRISKFFNGETIITFTDSYGSGIEANLNIETIDYNQIVYMDNWRKTDVD